MRLTRTDRLARAPGCTAVSADIRADVRRIDVVALLTLPLRASGEDGAEDMGSRASSRTDLARSWWRQYPAGSAAGL
jgi:hypothetical protein